MCGDRKYFVPPGLAEIHFVDNCGGGIASRGEVVMHVFAHQAPTLEELYEEYMRLKETDEQTACELLEKFYTVKPEEAKS